MAALCVAARVGFEMENALEVAEKTYVDVNIHAAENAEKLASLNTLPTCCVESADALGKQRTYFEAFDVFAPAMIDATTNRPGRSTISIWQNS